MSSQKINSISDTEDTPCDIKSNLLIARLLGIHLKEDKSSEMKEQDDKKMPLELFFPHTESDKKLNLEFNMWHSVGPFKTNDTKLLDSTEESVHRTHSEQYLAAGVKMVYDLLSTMNTTNKQEFSKTFLAMSSSPDTCHVLRQSGCLPLLLQLIHGDGSNKLVRKQALKALHCIVQHNSDDKQGRRETRVFKLIEQILEYCENEDGIEENSASGENINPAPAVASLMKLSFDEEFRHAMCQFGALQALAKLVQTDHAVHKDVANLSQESITVRRYAGMALTNLTFGDVTNKALLCSLKPFMTALVAQLKSPNEDLCQVTAGVLRNLSWRADSYIKEALREVDAVTSLMKTALRIKKESTLKAVLSALWNLSAHNNFNKMDICNVDGAIEYLVKMLNYQAPSGTLTIVESVGGILRNISSIIAVRDDYRAIIRNYNCLLVLLHQLKSPSLTIVSNACGTLWNLTARCAEDQSTLYKLGAIPMLRSLIHSRHKMISVASTAALKNLMNFRTDANLVEGSRAGASLVMRKRRALEQEMDARLKETAENVGQLDMSMSYDSMSTSFSEHSNYGKSGTVKNEELPRYEEKEETPLTKSVNSVRFNLSFEENDKKDVKCKSPTQKGILVKTEKKELFEDDVCGKTNGFRKIEEPYNLDDSFGDNAETDLDQPTDYSLRFREQNDLRKSEILVTGSVSESENYKEDKKAGAESVLETPLMFSRCSSLDSVSSCGGEHADDRSSVVSDFSRVVSGVVSPSELPDSPTQTVPSSPHPVAKTQFFGDDEKKSKPMRKSVFEDSVTVFKDENTPIAFSVATSLSSLTFDDEPHFKELEPVNEETLETKNTKSTNSSTVNTGSTLSAENVEEFPKDDVFDMGMTVEEQDAMLKACIDSGKNSAQELLGDETKEFSQTSKRTIPPAMISDSTINFCTEDTPVSISHAVSNSDLSLLCPSEDSFLQNSILPLSSCADPDEELSCEEQEKLLSFCIAEGLQTLSKSNETYNERKSSQSSTLSEITEDLLTDDHTLIKDYTPESVNLVATSGTETDFSFMNDPQELSEEEEKNLLNQCIALGMRSMKESTDLENIGPPSFLDEANLDSSLINIEEIIDYPPGKNAKNKCTPKQKRNESKSRFNTYTVKLSPTKICPKPPIENGKKSYSIKERRSSDKDRFKTRILSKGDFEEMARTNESRRVSKSPLRNQYEEFSDGEGCAEQCRAKIVKPVSKVKSGIPVVKSKIPAAKSQVSPKSPDFPVLQRQNTFTKEESSGIPVRKNSFKNSSKPNLNDSAQFRSAIPSRIKEPSPKVNRMNSDKSSDIGRNRWSVSENNLNSTNFKNTSSSSLNVSSHYGSKVSPSASHSALPVRRESSGRSSIHGYKK